MTPSVLGCAQPREEKEDMPYTMYGWDSQDEPSFKNKGYTLIADVDESESYDVDQTRIYLTPEGKFALATASGCSCWDGDWEVEDFDSLDELDASVREEDSRMYNPSLRGLNDLMEQARDYMSRNAPQPSV